MSYCSDCGTKLSGGMCPNCHEELYIFETQYDDLPPLSEKFASQVREQRDEVKRRKLT